MRKLALIILAAMPLFADFFPATRTTTVADVNQEKITLSQPLPTVGMSAAVVHDFNGKLQAVTGYIEQTSAEGSASLLFKDVMPHDKLPSIKTPVQKGDKVIGGYLYDRVLLLAPNAQSYQKVTEQYSRTWVHPDLYALFLARNSEEVPTKENLKTFARTYQVGLVCVIQKERMVLIDPLTGKRIAQKALQTAQTTTDYPFYRRLKNLNTGLFSSEPKGDYYKTIQEL